MRVHSGPKNSAPIVRITLHPICTPIAGTECSNFKMDIQMINLDSTPYLSGGMLQGSAHSRDRGTRNSSDLRNPRNHESVSSTKSGITRSHPLRPVTLTNHSNSKLQSSIDAWSTMGTWSVALRLRPPTGTLWKHPFRISVKLLKLTMHFNGVSSLFTSHQCFPCSRSFWLIGIRESGVGSRESGLSSWISGVCNAVQ